MHSRDDESRPARASSSLWWLHPFWIVAAPLMAISLVAYLLPDLDYRENWRSAKAFESRDLMLCLALAAAFSAGCLLASWFDAGFSTGGRAAPGPRDTGVGRRELRILFHIAWAATIAGYVVWFGAIIGQFGIGMFKNVLVGAPAATDDLKRAAAASVITGVTTLTQLGMGTALLGTFLGFTQGWRKVRLQLVLLLLVTAIRAVFLSERLSLIEIVLPSAVLTIRLLGFGAPGSILRRFLLVAPFVGIAGLYALFTFTEYFRSWSTFYAAHSEHSLFHFTLLRLLGYYVTALNNGAIEWHAHGVVHFPYAILAWLWNLPGIGEALQSALGGHNDPAELRTALLTAEGNPEFNNTSGIFVAFSELGVAGALLLFLLYGFVARLLHASYGRGSMAGLLLYSFLLVGMSEQLLIFYISEGRAFPTWALLLVAILLSRERSSIGRARMSPADEINPPPSPREPA
jgi:hypothetical protein